MKCFICKKETGGSKIKCGDCINRPVKLPTIQLKGGGWAGSRHIASKAPTYNDVVRSGAVKPKSYEEYKKENNL